MALDLALNTIPLDRLLALWPVSFAPGTRDWLGRNIVTGADQRFSRRLPAVSRRKPPQISLNYAFSDAEVTPLRTLPPITGGAGYGSAGRQDLHDR